MHIAIIAPPWVPVPPPAYGGTEAVLDTLARGLAAAGHVFQSDSHAELLLHGYEERGPQFFRDLNGYFAAAIWDTVGRRLVLVNDRFGLKPSPTNPLDLMITVADIEAGM